MSVNVVFFAAAREITGCDYLDLVLDDQATIGDVKQILCGRFPDLITLVERSTWAVDHEYVDDAKRLYDGAEIGLIPPVSGG